MLELFVGSLWSSPAVDLECLGTMSARSLCTTVDQTYMAYVVKIFGLVGCGKHSPRLIGGASLDAGGIKDSVLLAVLSIVTFLFTVVTFCGGLVGTSSGRVACSLADTTLAFERACLGALGFGVSFGC